MIYLRWDKNCEPHYMTQASSHCDVKSRVATKILAGSVGKVPTGIWIERVDAWDPSFVPELQLRCRSGLAAKHGIMMANGVGTIDADYRDEICCLLYNSRSEDFEIQAGDRIGQMSLHLVRRIPHVTISEKQRQGGFGSTLISSQNEF